MEARGQVYRQDGLNSKHLLEARCLKKSFGRFVAVDGVDITIDRGEIFGLVGPDGAGKTTTMKMLCGLVRPTGGEVYIDGINVHKNHEIVKSSIGYMSQDFTLYSALSIEENIKFFARAYGVPKDEQKERMQELLAFSRLGPFKDRFAGNLSGGMKKKLALSCALIHTPKVLFLDEPTTGVDPVSRQDFWLLLYKLLEQGVVLFVNTPYMDEAERCNRIALMHAGKVLICNKPRNITLGSKNKILEVRAPNIRDIFNALRKKPIGNRSELYGNTMEIMSIDEEQDVMMIMGLSNKENGIEIHSKPIRLEGRFVEILEMEGHKKRQLDYLNLPFLERRKNEDCIDVKDLYRYFGGFVAVGGISFSVPQGQIFGFLGPNGAGKTTTIRMLTGLLHASKGQIVVAGVNMRKNPAIVKHKIGYMSQIFSLYNDLTVSENIELYGGIYGITGSLFKKRKAWVLSMTGLERFQRLFTKSLSMGYKQRLALGCAIIHDPEVVFLDEPTAGVDPISRREFFDLIGAMSELGITVFVTTHYMDEAERCENLALMYGGKIIAMGPPLELKRSKEVPRLVEVRVDDSVNVFNRLSKAGWEGRVRLFGESLHIAVDDKVSYGKDNLTGALSSFNVDIEKIEYITPSMEDVFVSFILKEEAKS